MTIWYTVRGINALKGRAHIMPEWNYFKRFMGRNGAWIVVLTYFVAALLFRAAPGLFPDWIAILFNWVEVFDAEDVADYL